MPIDFYNKETDGKIRALLQNFNTSTTSANGAQTKELEIRLKKVTHQDFSRFYTYLNAAASLSHVTTTLDISVVGGTRGTIEGEENIRAYCTSADAALISKLITKQHVGNLVDIDEYGFRAAFNIEETKSTTMAGAAIKQKKDVTYRFKKRVSIVVKQLFRFDLTIVKQGNSLQQGLFSSPDLYEVECEFVGGTQQMDMTVFMNMLTLMAQIQQENEYPISNTLQNVIKGHLQTLRLQQKTQKPDGFLGAKVATLGLEQLQLVRNSKYHVTDKADGERRLLFIDQGYLFFCDMDMNITRIPVQVEDKGLSGTVIDGELIVVPQTDDAHKFYNFYAFDILFAKGGLLLKEEQLPTRYSLLAATIATMASKDSSTVPSFESGQELNFAGRATFQLGPCIQFVLHAKTYFVAADAHKIWCNKDKYPYSLDGLIFTPSDQAYPHGQSTWMTQYKWKPPAQNSIDFEINFGANNIHSLLVGNRDIMDKGKSQFATIEFVAGEEIGRDDHIVIQDKTIVECIYSTNKKWVVLKTRIDKTVELQKLSGARGTTANYKTTAEAIWKSIQNPVEESLFCGEGAGPGTGDEYYKDARLVRDKEKSQALRNFQNNVKFWLLQKHEPKSLIDFSCGHGGDFHKWQRLGLHVSGIDLSETNLVQFLNRLKKDDDKRLYLQQHVQLFAGNTGEPLEGQPLTQYTMAADGSTIKTPGVFLPPTTQHDLGASFFSVHYYFKNEAQVSHFFRNAAQYIKPDGHLLITCLDGQSVFDALNRSSTGAIEGNVSGTLIWKFEKQYDPSATFNSFGLQIGFYMHTIFQDGTLHPEYLVPHDLLVRVAQEHGFWLEETAFFDQIKDTDVQTDPIMNTKEYADLKTFKNWHRFYDFIKVATAPAPAAEKKRKRAATNSAGGPTKKRAGTT
jgi:hypothetical protein